MFNRLRFLSLGLMSLLLLPLPMLHAEEVTGGGWANAIVILTPTPKIPKLKLYLEGHGRVETDQVDSPLERTAIFIGPGYEITPKTTVWTGYAWSPTYDPTFNNEHLIWQQITHSEHPKGGDLLLRGRLEERLIQGNPDTLVWGRAMARYQRDFSKKCRFYWVAQNELIANLNDSGRNEAGFSQNRAFVGIGRHINKHVNAEVGYMTVLIYRPQGEDGIEHILMLNVIVH